MMGRVARPRYRFNAGFGAAGPRVFVFSCGREGELAQDAHQDGPGLGDIGVECREQILDVPGDQGGMGTVTSAAMTASICCRWRAIWPPAT